MIQALLAGGGLLLNGIKTIFGDRSAREQFGHTQTMASLNQFAAEFGRPPRNWFDGLIDGINRLPRPVLAFTVFYLFWLAYADPVEFQAIMASLTTVPDPLWYIMGIIIGFYFGGRMLHEKLKFRVDPEQMRAALQVASEVRESPKTTGKTDELNHAPRDNP